jgi:integrase
MAAKASLTIKSRPLADGTVRWSLYFRPALPDGTTLIPVPNATTLADRPVAEALAATYRKAIADGHTKPQPETCAGYFKRWNAARKTKYPRQATHDEQVFRLWLADQIGATPIRGVTRDQLIELSHHLDQLAAKGEAFGEARARNIYSVCAAMFRDAYSSKDRALRVLDSNPMADVPWPERSARKALKQMLFPAEFLALVSCPHVPIVRARLYAVTLYTTTRAAEVRVFDCSHFDVVHGSVQILMSDDPMMRKATGDATATKSTKSGKARLASLEPTLAPVVAAMVEELGGTGRLFPERPKGLPQANQWRPATEDYIPGPDGAYGLCGMFKRDLRAALKWAGIAERPELFDDSNRRASLSIRFHDLRASGITWRHARRDNPQAILQECGHEDQATNAIYIRALRGLAPAELFPALPARLVSCDPRVNRNPEIAKKMVGAEGLEESENGTILRESGTLCEPSQREKTSRDDVPRDRSHLTVVSAEQLVTALDIPRAAALASAVDAFVRAGMLDHARPLAAELAALLRAAEGTGATVAVLGTKRERR